MTTVLWGPTTITVPEVYTASPDPASYDESLCVVPASWTGQAGDVITVSFTAAIRSSGGVDFDVYLKQVGTAPKVFAGNFLSGTNKWTSLAGGASGTVTLPGTGSFEVLVLDGGNGIHGGGGIGDLVNFEVTTSATTSSACGYGTSVQPSVPDVVLLVPALLIAIIGAVTDGWAWPLVGVFGGYTLDVQFLCSRLPPVAPTITQTDILQMLEFPPNPTSVAAIAKGWQWVQAAAWPHFCRCNPGSPAPTPPAATVSYTNPGTQPQPTVTCDDTDLCSLLNSFQQQLNSISQQISIVNNYTQLIQRQSVPFAYVPGTVHFGLSGSGTLSVQGIVGLSVQSTTIPPYLSADMDPVNSYFKLGTISLGTADGWERRQIVTHNPHLILGVSGEITEVGYLFEPGVTANILELLREP